MKISENWLRSVVDPALDTQALVEQITMAGLEVDAVEPVAGNFSGVIVGEILTAKPHPDADKLRVCEVAGLESGTVQVVCGAPNAAPGMKVPFATVGAKLPGDLKIKQAKLRGVESFGMLCAEEELGLAESSEGLMSLPADAPVGQDLREYLKLDDNIIEVDLTPNRADCLSVRGVAREIAVLNALPFDDKAGDAIPASQDVSVDVQLLAPEACPKYVGRVISGVDVRAASPLWLQERLRRSGIRSIDVIVDITNYVLLEIGQPMHAFDLEKVQGGIRVRMSEAGEELLLLDGQMVALDENTLVIADEKSALAMAGIMGGEPSSVSESTTSILLEAAFFNPLAIAGKARAYGLHTDSSHRFERGVDFSLQERAIERATQLILELAGGEAGPLKVVESSDHMPASALVALNKASIPRYLGLEIADERIESMMQSLGMHLHQKSDSGWEYLVPSWRFDISREVDLLEEVARIYGYNNLPTRSFPANLVLKPAPESCLDVDRVKERLLALGYCEAITYSFVDPALQQYFSASETGAIDLLNPISADMSQMRLSLVPGLLKTAIHNLNRQQNSFRLFETGLSFSLDASGKMPQRPVLAALITGIEGEGDWSLTDRKLDFFDLKGDLESLLTMTSRRGDFLFDAANLTGYHPGQTAVIRYRQEGESVEVGFIAAIHPSVQASLDLSQAVYVFEICLDSLLESVPPRFEALSRFPEVERDLAFVVDKTVSAGDLCEIVREKAGSYLVNLKVFDVYSGEGIDPHRKSIGLSLTFQHKSRTLTESEINSLIEDIVAAITKQFSAELRN